MKRNGIEYPEPPAQGKRKEQLEASAAAIIKITILFIAVVIATFIWNKFF
jgi:hypothetical protein